MKIKEHAACLCTFWRPSLARRITLYFLLFGLIVFFVTAALFTISSKKQFMDSTSKLINHQLSQLEASKEPDFIWNGINESKQELYHLLEILANLSSTFYTVKDISIYGKLANDGSWHRLYFPDGPTLQSNRILHDPYTGKLDRWLDHHFRPSKAKIMAADGLHSMFVNISGPKDTNNYFLKIGVDSAGMAGFMKRQVKILIIFLVISLVCLRIIGYWFARKIAGPIETLSEISSDVAKGDLSKTAQISSNDEIGELANNFNHMIEGLREWERIKMIEFEMEKGQKIQRDFLPATIPSLPDWNIATAFFPAGKVSGDFYDVFKISDGNIGLVIADVCDKGVGSALYMALFRSLIRVFAEQVAYCDSSAVIQLNQPWETNPSAPSAEDLQKMRLRAVPFTSNYIAKTHGEEGMFATLFFGVLNPETGILYYINGGHEPLYLINSDGVKQKINPTGPAVGMWPDTSYDIGQIKMEPGDMLIGYTDGVTEARSPADEIFTRSRLRSLIEQPFTTASEMLDRVRASLFSFIDIAPRSDDVTMLAVERIVNTG
jgi:serine phosphatase RsbU (regulator of sigma subunit)